MGGCAASRSPPRRGRNASAGEPPEPYRGCSWGGTAADGGRAAATGRKTTPRRGVRALCACARRSRAVFRFPVGDARHANAAVSPRKHSRYGSGDSRAEALRLRRGGGRDAVSPSADPWTGRRRLWLKANRRRRGGQGGAAPCGFFPLFLGRPRNRAACRGGTRQATPLTERKI